MEIEEQKKKQGKMEKQKKTQEEDVGAIWRWRNKDQEENYSRWSSRRWMEKDLKETEMQDKEVIMEQVGYEKVK